MLPCVILAEKMTTSHKIIVRKTGVGTHRRRRQDNIKMNTKNLGVGILSRFVWHRTGTSELSVSYKAGNFLVS